jgi:hypothetical protein
MAHSALLLPVDRDREAGAGVIEVAYQLIHTLIVKSIVSIDLKT